jgi:hypothetical protein
MKMYVNRKYNCQIVGLLEQYLSQPENRLALVPSTLGLTDPTRIELVAGYNRLVRR